MNSAQVTAAAKAVGDVEQGLTRLAGDVTALESAQAAQQQAAAVATQQAQPAVDTASSSVINSQQALQPLVTAAVAALVAMGQSITPPAAA